MDTAATIASRARASWVCPLIAWVSQFILASVPPRGLALLFLAAAIVQFVLIAAGIYLGAKTVSLGKSIDPSSRRQGIIGLVLSCGTILLIVAAIVFASLAA